LATLDDELSMGPVDGDREETVRRRRAIGIPPAFRHPKYRMYWLGFFLAVSGHQIFQFVQFVLVYELTGSVVALGVLGAANAAPGILLGVIGGVFADRWEKRRLIITTQFVSGIAVLLLAVLTSVRLVEVWHVLAVAIVVSTVGAFDGPARSAYYPKLIPQSAMISAVALNSTIWQATRIIGPAAAGVIVGTVADVPLDGMAIALYIAVGGYVAMIAAMAWIRLSGEGESKGNPLGNLVDGLKYIRGDRNLFTLIMLAFASALFGWSYVILMPVIALDILGVGEDGLGALLAAAGVGATVITVTLAVVDTPLLQRRGWFVVGGSITNGLLIIGFALTADRVGSFPLALVFMFFLGFTQMVYTTGTMGSIQLMITDAMRGRVLGVYGIVWGIQPLSGTLVAFIARFVGVPVAVSIGGAALVAVALVAVMVNPDLRHLRTDEQVED
jgi:MFS family permease